MGAVLTMTAADLRQRVRDRSVLVYALVVPLALMTVFNLMLGPADEVDLDAVTVAASAPADDPLAGSLLSALSDVEGLPVTLEELAPVEVRERTRAGDAALGVIVPAGFAASLTAGEGPTVEVIEGDDAGTETDVLVSVLEGVLDRLAAGAVAGQAARAAGVGDPGAVARATTTAGPSVELVEGRAADQQLTGDGMFVAGQAGLFLLFTVGFGVLGLVQEREQGTLARLHSMPIRAGAIVVAKALVSYVLGVAATTVLLVVGSLLFDVSFGSPAPVAVLVLSVVAAATTLMFIIVRLARTAEQASTLQSILAFVLGIAGGAFFPLTATGAVGRLLDLNPVAAFVRGLGITSGGGGLSDIGTPVAVMAGFAVVCLAASRLVPDRAQGL